ncbi:MAG: hypothetical protein MRK01_06510 [Candidatus Scalindua sp.]|nr:hypothetical protein [Candidatus Scalindua sp.]
MVLSEILKSKINESLSVLKDSLVVSNIYAETHTVVEVTGWQREETIDALAVYLVSLRAGVIDQAGSICSDLIGSTPDYAYGILRSVNEIIEQSTDSKESQQDWKSKWRNAWIAEGIWHCCMHIAMKCPEFHTQGTIIALDLPNVSPKDHGLDVTALYVRDDGILGMSFVETKAYRNNPNEAISKAVIMFESIEAGVHDTRLRQVITSFNSVIEKPYKQQLSLSLWKNERTLIPNPHYEANGVTVQWGRPRTAFNDLTAPVVVMPHAVDDFDAFFDEISSFMRIKAEELVDNV